MNLTVGLLDQVVAEIKHTLNSYPTVYEPLNFIRVNAEFYRVCGIVEKRIVTLFEIVLTGDEFNVRSLDQEAYVLVGNITSDDTPMTIGSKILSAITYQRNWNTAVRAVNRVDSILLTVTSQLTVWMLVIYGAIAALIDILTYFK